MYFFSRGLRINPGATEAELMIVGVSGTLVNFLGLFGNLNYFVVFLLIFLTQRICQFWGQVCAFRFCHLSIFSLIVRI